MASTPIPTVGTYRGVGIHAFQPEHRIETVVKPAIDAVSRLTDLAALAAYAQQPSHPPEARLFAAARCEAAWQLAAESRAVRPVIDLDKVKATVAGLNSLRWMDRRRYTSLLDPYHDKAVLREEPLPDSQT